MLESKDFVVGFYPKYTRKDLLKIKLKCVVRPLFGFDNKVSVIHRNYARQDQESLLIFCSISTINENWTVFVRNYRTSGY